MINGTIRHGAATVTIRWDGARAHLEGDPELADRAQSILTPGSTAFYNPRRGGLYRGFDPSNLLEVGDAMKTIAKWPGVVVDFALPAELGDAPPPSWASADGKDWRDEAVVRAAEPTADQVLHPPQPRVQPVEPRQGRGIRFDVNRLRAAARGES